MPSSEIPPKSKGFEEIVLWIVAGLFLALGVAWTAYPKIYVHYHPGLAWPVVPQRWRDYSGTSPLLVYFLLASWTAACGFWQLRFSRWFGRGSSKSLLWLYLFFSFLAVVGSWTFALGSQFWTISVQKGFYEADGVLEIGRMLVKLGLFSSLGAALLNVGYSLVRGRRV
jgi:hypothetical protein